MPKTYIALIVPDNLPLDEYTRALTAWGFTELARGHTPGDFANAVEDAALAMANEIDAKSQAVDPWDFMRPDAPAYDPLLVHPNPTREQSEAIAECWAKHAAAQETYGPDVVLELKPTGAEAARERGAALFRDGRASGWRGAFVRGARDVLDANK